MKTSKEDFLDSFGKVNSIVTEDAIYGLFGYHRALSNFHSYPVTVDGLTYCCSEAAYMAQKSEDMEVRKMFSELQTGFEAKQKGKTVELRPDWDEVHRIHAMYRVLLAKFTQDSDALAVLLSTGSKYIEETNWWGDMYWGKCNGVGKNHLGHLLMTVRDFMHNLTKP